MVDDCSYGILHIPTGLWVVTTLIINGVGDAVYLHKNPRCFYLEEACLLEIRSYNRNNDEWELCEPEEFEFIRLREPITFPEIKLDCKYHDVEEYCN